MAYIDNHTHSSFSADSREPIEGLVGAALARGLAGICITDHFDFDVPNGVIEFTFDPVVQQQAIDVEQERVNATRNKEHPFSLLKGIEIGIQPKSLEKIKALMANHTFDTVVASLHFVEGHDPFHGAYYKPYGYREAYCKCLEDMLYCMTHFTDYDILGHFDYIARYAPYKEHVISLAEFGEWLDPMLTILAQNGKTFEINTKTYHTFAFGTPALDENILRRFRFLGGEAISLGSDAHAAARVGDQFEKYAALALRCGIKYGVYFKNRQPVYYTLE